MTEEDLSASEISPQEPNCKNTHFDYRWLLIIPFLIVLIVVGVIINNNNEEPVSESTTIDTDDEDLEINWNKYETYNIELENALTITKSGTYNISGSIYDGGITINVTEGFVKLVLKDATIVNPNGPAISCIAGDDLVIESVGENYLEDGKTYSANLDEDINGAIYSKADLTLTGDGLLKVVSHFQDGIVSKDDLTIRSGNYNIVSADDAIRGKDSVHIVNGTFAIDSVSDAIKSTNDTDTGKGFVYIENGDFTIYSGDDGIHAESALIIDNGKLDILKSYEGLEAVKITINDGEISVVSTDDGINAGGGSSETNTPRPGGMMDADENCVLTINGGNIYINAAGDGLDSNGYVYINGGKIVVDGPTNNGNGALDSGISFIVNGGEAIAVGSSGMAETLGEKSTIYNISVYAYTTYRAGTKIEIKNAENETVLEHTSAKQFSNIAAASPNFVLGETYTIYFDGQEYNSFMISGITTKIGTKSSRNNFGK